MLTIELQRKYDLTLDEVESLRSAMGHKFGARVGHRVVRRVEHRNRIGMRRLELVPLTDWEFAENIVTNEGLDHALDVILSGGTQISAWYVALVKTNTSPAAGMTYATPTYTEIAGSDVTETLRQAWTDGGVSSQSVDNSGSPAQYTANGSFTAYGAGLVGGGTAATTIANTAGGGTLWAMALFGSSKSMVATDTIDITYTHTSADDGV